MFLLSIKTDGEAFEAPAMELARMLRALADRLDNADSHFATQMHGQTVPLRDVNGNTCGQFSFMLPRSEWPDHDNTPGESAKVAAEIASAVSSYVSYIFD